MSKREGRLYVLELTDGVYVGSTFKAVEDRIRDNFTRKDGTIGDPQRFGEDGGWKYGSSSIKHIRKTFQRLCQEHLGDYAEQVTDSRDQLEEWETKLSAELQKAGWIVFGDKA